MRKIHSIVIHHTAGGQAVSSASIDRSHRRRGWRGIGYHRVITKHAGTWHCENGRDLNRQGAHAGAFKNRGSIGITVCGHYVEMLPPREALIELYREIYSLNKEYQSQGPNPCEPLLVIGHCDLKRTLCPGQQLYNYITSIREGLQLGLIPTEFVPFIEERPLAVDRPIGLRNLKIYKQWTRA